MKPAKMGFLLGIFIFCSVTAPVLSGVARLTHNICREYKESCNMDVDPGSCYEVHFRFFYNRTAGECQSFVFTGCNGNLNNYRLKIECDIECNEEYRTVRYTKPPPPTTIPPTKATTAQKSENLRIQKRKPFRLTRRRKYRKSQEYKRHHRSRGWWQARSQRKAATKNIRA